jgi:hypothetical protein
MAIDATNGVNFIQATRSAAAATSAIELVNNTGGPITFGNPAADTPGESGMIAGGTADAIVIDNSANVTISALEINQTMPLPGVVRGVLVKTDAGAQTVNLNDLEINDGDIGIEVMRDTGAGTLTMTINDTMINDSTDVGLSINNVDAGTINVNDVTIDGDPANATAQGVLITDSDATITFDAQTLVQNWGSADFEATGDLGTINFNGDVVNTDATGNSVHIHNVSGGAVTFTATSSINDQNAGLLVESNTGGTFSFLGTNTFNTAAADAVTVRNNTGNTDVLLEDLAITTTAGRGVAISENASTTSVNISGVDVTSEAGDAFVATDAGDLTVSGNDNVLQTTSGVGLKIEDQNIVSGATFQEVSVSKNLMDAAGTSNGIVLQNVTGAQITVGEAGGAADSGGNLDTTDNAIVLTNVANVDLNNIQIERTTGAGTDGIFITHNNAATMDVTINDTDIDMAADDGILTSNTGSGVFNLNINRTDISSAGAEGFDFATSGAANDVNIRIDALTSTDDFVVTAGDNAAVDLRIDNSSVSENTMLTFNSGGNIDLLLEDSVFDASAGVALQMNFGTSTADVDAIVRSNDGAIGIRSADASAFVMTATGANAEIDLLLDANSLTTGSGSPTVDIDVTGGATVDANILNNTLAETGGGDDVMTILSDGATTQFNLHLDNNTANPASSDYELTTMNQGVPMVDFNFSVQNRDTADARNAGDVIFILNVNEFENISGPVAMPTLP